MKLVVVMQHSNFFRNLETVVRELDLRGHETVMLYGGHADELNVDPAKAPAKTPKISRGMQLAEAEVKSLTTGPRPTPPERWQRWLKAGRLVINRAIYLRKDHPSPDRVVGGLEKQLPRRIRRSLRWRPVRAALGHDATLPLWRRIELKGPASLTLTAILRSHAPDVVLVSPSVWPKNPVEADYIRAARDLGIPTIGYVNSWDNLTSKGTVHVLPNTFVVWNEAMAREAEEIHLIPRQTIRVTGAPHVDHFFDLRPSRPRAELCRELGLPDDGPYVVYLCSSRTLIADETAIVSALADALVRALGDREPSVVVRPDPVNPDPWNGYEHPGTAVYPRHGDQADTAASWQEYFDQLAYASAFIGLNTTAFLEAATADHPCLTIVSDEFFDQQGKTGHFRHLLDAGFLEASRDVDEVAARVGRVLDGADEKAEQRRGFVESFLRPRGLATPARRVVADTIEEAAGVQRQAADAAQPLVAALATEEGS
jgi:hypothetical protein